MEEIEVLVIGAGIVGLAIGYKLSESFDEVLVVDKESGFGKHTSSRNSEVVHSGIYYQENSLKAELCVKGNKLLYEFADKYDIPYRQCGKYVVATSQEEIFALEELKIKGEINGVNNLKIIEEKELKKKNPQIKGVGALWVAGTGIIDTHRIMQTCEMLIEKNEGMIAYNTEIIGIEYIDKKYEVAFKDGTKIKTKTLINSAGLFSEEISKMLGIKTEKNDLKIHWCKGEYYKSSKIKNINHLIYPLPDPNGIFLGIHLTINLQNEVRFGPNAYYVDKLDYKMDTKYKNDFVEAISRYIDIEPENLNPDDVGIRPKLQGPSDEFRDFYIKDEKKKGFPSYINLTGIESPGLTACLAIAEKIKKTLNY